MTHTIIKKNNVPRGLKNTLKQVLMFLPVVLIVILSFYQCANIQTPTGGPKDSIPPKILSESPSNLKTNFQDKKIVVEFDEFVRLENQQKEISYSPDMPKPPKFVIRKKSLHMELPDSLEKETTYVINFGKSIVDNNERNPLVDYKYVFSTGSKIDSLTIKGKVTNALTSLPEKEIPVILIPIEQDSIFGKKKANIFTYTDTTGNFTLSYLKENQYRIYALKESNNDRIYNSPTEGIAFLKDSINLQKDTTGINLYLSVPNPLEFKVLDRKIENSGKIVLKFNQSVEGAQIKIVHPQNLDSTKIVKFNQKMDSVNLWVENLEFDSLRMNILNRENKELESILLRKSKNDKFTRDILLTDNIQRTNKVDRTEHLIFNSSSPIRSVDKSQIEFREDSILRTNYQLLRDSTEEYKFIIRYNWKPKLKYSLKIDTGAFIGPFGEENKLVSKDFTFDENEKYGDIKLKITIPDSTQNYLVELLNSTKTEVLKTDIISYLSGKMDYEITYTKFLEGKYFVRIIYDRNRNNKWDPAVFEEKLQPEETWLFDKALTIRPNWEQEEVINIPPPQIKD